MSKKKKEDSYIDAVTVFIAMVSLIREKSENLRKWAKEHPKEGEVKYAQKAISYADRLDVCCEKLKEFCTESLATLEELYQFSEEMIAVDKRSSKEPKKSAAERKAAKNAPKSSFSVTFPDGNRIFDMQAKTVLAKAIAKIGPKKVAELDIKCNGEPLVSKDKSVYKKQPSMVASLGKDWFVKTHSSTAEKMKFLARISKALNLNLKIEKLPLTTETPNPDSGDQLPLPL